MKIVLTVIFAVMVFLQGCGDTQTNVKDENVSQRDIPESLYQVLDKDTYPNDPIFYEAGKDFSYDLFYSDNSDDINAFENLYRQLTGKDAPLFDGTMIVARAGLRSTGGYHLEIVDVVKNEEEVTVKLHEEKPKPTDMVTMALTYPYIVVVIPEYFGEVNVVLE